MNIEFQELKGRLNMPGEIRDEIIKHMRDNLLSRNNNEHVYTLGYTDKGRSYDITNCSEEELLKIDGDMSPLGL